MLVAPEGTLYGKISLEDMNLNNSTDFGQIVQASCNSMLFAKMPMNRTQRPSVYEAELMSYIRDSNILCVSISATCVIELELITGNRMDVQVQFELNRRPFQKMHRSVDSVKEAQQLRALFPASECLSTSQAFQR